MPKPPRLRSKSSSSPTPADNTLIWLVGAVGLIYLLSSQGGVISSPPPFKVKALSAVIVRVADNPGNAEQKDVIDSLAEGGFRDIILKAGGQVRILDPNNNTSNEQWVKDGFAKWTADKPLPFVSIGGVVSGTSCPLPPTKAECVALARKFK